MAGAGTIILATKWSGSKGTKVNRSGVTGPVPVPVLQYECLRLTLAIQLCTVGMAEFSYFVELYRSFQV